VVYLVLNGRRNRSRTITTLEKALIGKTRYEKSNHIYASRQFYDDNEGETMAEIELSSEDEQFPKTRMARFEVRMTTDITIPYRNLTFLGLKLFY
jgi:CYTH domain-containing protein